MPASHSSRRYDMALSALIMAALIIASILYGWTQINALIFNDPDDFLRMVEIRDLLAGQSWFDVTQYRMNPPHGGLMHWSRLVDVPIAAIILTMEPLFGTDIAERIAVTVWPMVVTALFGFFLVKIAFLFARRWMAPASIVLMAFCGFITVQSGVLRIDHHNMQMLAALAALYFSLRDTRPVSAFWTGLFLALQASISIEGLAFVPAFGLLYIWPWLTDSGAEKEEGARMTAFLASFTLVSGVTLLATRGVAMMFTSYCDAISAPYMLAAAVGSAVLALAAMLPLRTIWARGAAIALAVALALIAVALVSPQCLSGPFAQLDPIVRLYWYDKVLEGRPLTKQPAVVIGYHLVAVLLGLYALLVARAKAADENEKQRWTRLFWVSIPVILLSFMIARIIATAHLFLLPATAWLLLYMWEQSRAKSSLAARMGGLIAALAVAWPISAPYVGAAVEKIDPVSENNRGGVGKQCIDPAAQQALNALQPGIIFAPLDIGSNILERTQHSIVTSGYHRNNAMMKFVIETFIASPEAAEASVRHSGAAYVALCPEFQEVRNYASGVNKHSFAATLPVTTPDWLCPVPIEGKSQLLLYRVKPVNGTCPTQ